MDIAVSVPIGNVWCEPAIARPWIRDLGGGPPVASMQDLAGAALPAIKRVGIRPGVGTHDDAELDAALAMAPDYVAPGPIYPTILEAMTWAPQGRDRIATEGACRASPERLLAVFDRGCSVGRRRDRCSSKSRSGGAYPRMDRGDPAVAVDPRARCPRGIETVAAIDVGHPRGLAAATTRHCEERWRCSQ